MTLSADSHEFETFPCISNLSHQSNPSIHVHMTATAGATLYQNEFISFSSHHQFEQRVPMPKISRPTRFSELISQGH
jgi:hypothetical protein